jgi:pimeloyl-ACP methyl ester carboxylesterase
MKTQLRARPDLSPAAHGGRGGRRTAIRRVVATLVALSLFLVIAFTAATWYFSGRIDRSALHVEPLYDQSNVVVTGSGPGWVDLQRTRSMSERLAGDMVYGLTWGGGFGILRPGGTQRGDAVRRELQVLSGTAPSEGTDAQVLRDVYPLDPGLAVGFGYTEVSYRSAAGTFPAYLAAGSRDTWAILVHGRGATRAEMFRLMKVTVATGLPSLDIGYRHDREAGGGRALFGQEEWRDLEAAAQYALDHGARRLVLVGASMGGGLVASFLEHSPLASKVDAVVLDAAMLDFEATVRRGAADVHLPVVGTVPAPLTWAAIRLADRRYGLDLGELDHLDDASWVEVPVLAFHGADDPKNPVSATLRLRDANPDLVQAVVLPGAGHVESWNADPQAYEQRVRDFLTAALDHG